MGTAGFPRGVPSSLLAADTARPAGRRPVLALVQRVRPRLFSNPPGESTQGSGSGAYADAAWLALNGLFAAGRAGIGLLVDYARVRAVVEDRRSAVGALRAALRFMARRPAPVAGLWVLNLVLLALMLAGCSLVAPAAMGFGRFGPFFVAQLYTAAHLLAMLVAWASQTSYFQSQLAHPTYVARARVTGAAQDAGRAPACPESAECGTSETGAACQGEQACTRFRNSPSASPRRALSILFGMTAGAEAAAQSPEQLEQAVERELRRDRALRRLDVSVAGDEVTLRGRVRHFWDKNEALRRTFDVRGVGAVVSEIEVPVQEDQEELVEDVSRAIQRYPHYRIWDYIDGRIDNGAVRIFGQVTPERDKAGELFERIAKVRGVQDVQVNLTPLSPSSSDERLRYAIGRQLARSEHFQRFVSMPNPPFHIIVNNSVVTLVGYVQSRIEYIEMQRIVAQTQGVLRVDNQLQTVR